MSNLRFTTDEHYSRLEGEYAYVPEESSLIYKSPKGIGSGTSLVMGTMQIFFSMPAGQLLYIEGYTSPRVWKSKDISPPASPKKIAVIVQDTRPFLKGEGVDILEGNTVETIWNPKIGWLCIGDLVYPEGSRCIEFAKDSIVVIYREKILAVWMFISNFQKI